jgi:hypothetical protein
MGPENRAKQALQAYPGERSGDLRDTIVDLITDLLHLARSLDIEPDYVITTARLRCTSTRKSKRHQ